MVVAAATPDRPWGLDRLADQSEPINFLLSAAIAVILIGGALSAFVAIPRVITAFQDGTLRRQFESGLVAQRS